MNLNKFAHRTQFLVSFGYLGHNFYGVQEQPLRCAAHDEL